MRIALTGAGTATATGFFKALRMYYEMGVNLIGLDMNPDNSCVPFVDLSLRVPRSDSEYYAEYLADLCSKLSIDLLLPILDSEFITLKDKKGLFGSAIFMPDYCWQMTDKKECAALLEESGCPGPRICSTWQGEKLIWKPRYGAGGVGIKVIEKEEDTRDLGGDGLLFDFIEGKEYTVDFLASDGEVEYAAQRLRLMTRGGVCTIARVEPLALDAEVQLKRIVSTVQYEGPGCFQYIRDRSGHLYWTDLNPRVGGGTMLTVAAGLNIPGAFVSHLMGDPMPEMHLRSCTVVRYFEEFLV